MESLTVADIEVIPLKSGTKMVKSKYGGHAIATLSDIDSKGSAKVVCRGWFRSLEDDSFTVRPKNGRTAIDQLVEYYNDKVNQIWGGQDAIATWAWLGLDDGINDTKKQGFKQIGVEIYSFALETDGEKIHAKWEKSPEDDYEVFIGHMNDGADISSNPVNTIFHEKRQDNVGRFIFFSKFMKKIREFYPLSNYSKIFSVNRKIDFIYYLSEKILFNVSVSIFYSKNSRKISDDDDREVQWSLELKPVASDIPPIHTYFKKGYGITVGEAFTIAIVEAETLAALTLDTINIKKLDKFLKGKLCLTSKNRWNDPHDAEQITENTQKNSKILYTMKESKKYLHTVFPESINVSTGFIESNQDEEPSFRGDFTYRKTGENQTETVSFKDDFFNPFNPDEQESESEADSSDTRQTLVVLDKIGSPGGREGAQAVSQYGFLTKKALPLCGSNDAQAIRQQLDAEWPWATKITEEACRLVSFARHIGKPFFYCKPLLLVGPPGVGKTSWACRLAEAAGAKSHVQCVGGAGDVYAIGGSSRIWQGASPSVIVKAMAMTSSANPLVCIDEIDKAPSGDNRHGAIADSLLPMLEVHSASKIYDRYLEGYVNAQWVTWVLTANSEKGLSEPFLDRCRVLRFPSPRPQDFDSLMASARRNIARQWVCSEDALPPLSEDTVGLLRKTFVKTLSVRKLVKHMENAMSYAIEGQPWTVPTEEDERTPMGFQVMT